MSQEQPPLAQRIIESDSDDEDPATELDAAGDTRRIIDGIIQPARTAGGPESNGDDEPPSHNHWDTFRYKPHSALNVSYKRDKNTPFVKIYTETYLHSFVTQNKFDDTLSVAENEDALVALLENPWGKPIFRHPTYNDLKHSHTLGETGYTDAFHKAINTMELLLNKKITRDIRSILQDDIFVSIRQHTDDFTNRILKFLRVAPCNLGSFKEKIEKYCHDRLGQPEKLKLSILHPESPGTQSASVERETAMDSEMRSNRELKYFAKGGDAGEFRLWDETNTNEPINGLFGSRRDRALQSGSNTISKRILYVLLCNIESLSKLTEKYELAHGTVGTAVMVYYTVRVRDIVKTRCEFECIAPR